MTEQRPCDCAGHHREFLERDVGAMTFELMHQPARLRWRPPITVPTMHDHEDARCSEAFLGIGGCPGVPHCRDWIIGAYRVGETLARETGDGAREFELSFQRRALEREFSRRAPLSAEAAR